MFKRALALSLLGALPGAASAIDWNPSAELGLVVTEGNSDTSSINGKVGLKGEDEKWIHEFQLAALRGEVEDEVTAKRYEFAGSSGYKFSERSYLAGSLRYESDDFSPFEYQAVAAVSYGYFAIKNELTTLLFEVGPGYRRAEPIGADAESDGIVRGKSDFKHKFTATTEMYNTLLVEAASDNTFAQDDIGVQVAINASLALKAGFQVRHNTDVQPGTDKTDTLTTLNLVWAPKH